MVGVAVAGLGEIGALHARNIAERVAGARLRRLLDQAPRVAAALGSELGVSWSRSYADALEDPGVDAIVISTPTPTHAAMVERAAAAGKHVFCEKPLSVDLDSGSAATRAMRAAGLHLQVGFQRRFDPGWLAAKRRVDAGVVGEIQVLRISHRNADHPHRGRTDRLGSLFVDMSVHDMDSARWLAGDVEDLDVWARPAAGGGDADAAVIVLRFQSGALAVIDTIRSARYGFECSAELVGTESTLRWGASGRCPVLEELGPDGIKAELPEDHLVRHGRAYLDELRHFVDCVASGRAPCVGGEDSGAALALALAAERSFEAKAG